MNPTSKKSLIKGGKDISAGIIGVGSFFPKRTVTNKELEALKVIGTSDEWITQKTGIKQRQFASSDMALSDICIPAARKALKDAGIKASEVDVIVVGAMSHDYPASILTGNIIKKAIGADNAYAIDLNVICAGSVCCLEIAAGLIESGKAKTVLVVNGEVFSKYPQTRVTSVIFGDGAAATVLKSVRSGYGILKTYIGSTADGAENLGIFVGGSHKIFSPEVAASGAYKIEMNGREIYKFAVEKFHTSVKEVLKQAGIPINKVKYIFSHQANINIIKEGMKMLGLPMSRTITNIDRHGNIGGGSVITVIDEAKRKGKMKSGDIIVTVAFGSGLAWGANVMRWCEPKDAIKG